MKDFIEGFQKLLPWLANLQIAPKIVISIIIILFAMFILLLIWSPTTQTKENRNSALPLDEHNKHEINAEGISPLTVKQIVDYINNAAPFQRDDIAKNYIGLKVNWVGTLWDVEKNFSDLKNVRVQLKQDSDHMFYAIYFNVPIEKYPQFKITQRGDLIGVSGRIVRCSGPGYLVELEVDKVVFHGKSIIKGL